MYTGADVVNPVPGSHGLPGSMVSTGLHVRRVRGSSYSIAY